MAKYYSVNGKIILAKNAKVQVTDLGLIRGYGIFDFLKIEKGVPLFIEMHLERFEQSAKEMHLDLNYSIADLKKLVLKLIAKNDLKRAGLKIILTGGYSEDGYTPSKNTNLIMSLNPFKAPSKKAYQNGVKLFPHEFFREMAMVKTTNYLTPILLLKKTKEAGAVDILYHWDGKISESSRANFFIIKKDKTIVTSTSNVLKGVTRKRILELAKKHYKVLEKDITFRDLKNASEAFLSSTTKGALPVTQVGDLKIGNGKPGKISTHLNDLLKKEATTYRKKNK